MRVPFRGGKPAGREELHTGDASEFGFGGRYRLIGDRFVVLQSATVVDIAQKKVVHTHAGENVLAVEGTRAFFDDRRDGGESGVFAFDAATGRREKVAETADARWWGGGAVSPDGTRRIVREWTGGPVKVGEEFVYKLAVERAGKPREVLDGEFAATCGTTGSGFMPDPPGVWLDNDRFLTQQTLGKLVVVNTADKTRRAVVEIPTALRPGERAWNVIGSDGFTPLGFQQPRFSLLPDGRAVYEADATYFVDVAKRTWEKPAWRPLGSGFDYSAVPDNITDVDRYSKAVTVSLRYRGEVIGTSRSVWWTTPEKPRVVVADGHLAVIERITRPGKAVPTDAVRVWTAAGGWAVLDGWADTVIGWVR